MPTPSQGIFTGTLPEMYERHLVAALFRPFAEELLNASGARDSVLDVACGTGIVARLAREKGVGRIVGVDMSAGMLGVARTVAPDIDWREGDATKLPLKAGESFEVVGCHQGLQFFRDKPAAIAEMRRALAPAGRLAVATWRPIEDVPAMNDLRRVAVAHLGEYFDVRHGFGDADALRGLLSGAGFGDIQIATVTRTVRTHGGAEMMARLNAMGVVGMSPAGKGMTDEQRAGVVAKITNESIAVLMKYMDGTDLAFDIGTNLAIAKV